MLERRVTLTSSSDGLMKQGPTVSVIIPIYNSASTLRRALDSVFAQEYKDFEVIIVNDGSTDELAGVLEHFSYAALRRIDHPNRRGAAAARNTGIREARGDYVAFLDADDEWLPTKLGVQVQAIEIAPSDDWVIFSGFYVHRGFGRVSRGGAEVRLPPEYPQSLERLVWGCDLSPGTTLLCRKSLFRKLGNFDESLERLEDWEWLLRSAANIRIRVVSEPLARIYVGAPPKRALVLSSLSVIDDRCGAKIRAQSENLWRIFKSTLQVERAATNYNNGHYFIAVFFVLCSLYYYHRRNRQFYRRLLNRASTFQLVPAVEHRLDTMHVITGLHTGGAEGALTALVLANSRQGKKQIVVALLSGGRNYEKLVAAGVNVISLNLSRGVSNPIYLAKALCRLASLIRRERPSVIQSWMYHADLIAIIALILSGQKSRTRLFWGLRCSDMDINGVHKNLRWIIRVCARLSRWVDGVVSNSEAGIKVHQGLGYCPPRFVLIDNGYALESLDSKAEVRLAVRRELGIDEAVVLVVAVARVDAMKDYANLLSAVSQVDNVETLTIGLGTEKLPQVSKVHRLGIRNDVKRLLLACDMAISSSAFGEGFSNAIAEAMSCGLPVIATDVGDSRRIVGDAGIIVPPKDSKALADAICTMACDADRRTMLGQLARERIKTRFSIDRMVRSFAELHVEHRVSDIQN